MLNDLLRRGYFPAELPALFSTISFARALSTNAASLPTPMTAKKATWTEPAQHSFARVGRLRRRLTVPNPTNFYRLSASFEANKAPLRSIWHSSLFSKTTPGRFAGSARAIAPPQGDRAGPRSAIRVGARYLVQADVSQFYSSIYSHAIAWSLHSKSTAKQNIKNMKLCGNVIDAEVQACQQGQTKGIHSDWTGYIAWNSRTAARAGGPHLAKKL